MITADSPFLAPQRISLRQFEHVLLQAGSPWLADAADIYELIVQREQDPAVWLAIAAREHAYGTNRNSVLGRNDTNSWTNARSVRDPLIDNAEVITDPVRRSQYVRYADVLDSVRDGLYRVTEEGYSYRRANCYSIAETIAIWTEDDPAGYVASIVVLVNHWMTVDPEPQLPFIPAQPGNYTASRRDPWPYRIIGHHTDGYDSLAELTRSARKVSATYLLHHDGTIRAQLVRHSDTQHTTGAENDRSLSFEWERKWPEQLTITDDQYANIAASVATMIRRERRRGNPHFRDMPSPAQFRDHNDYYNTTCPGNLDMQRVYSLVVPQLLPDYAKPQPSEISLDVGGIQRRIYGGIYQAWLRAGGLLTIGLPLDDEHDAPAGSDYKREQWFERGRAEWAPDRWPDNHDVTWGLLGRELLELQAQLAGLLDANGYEP